MKVLLIDDHPLILSALKTAISGLEDGVSVVDVADAQAAREVLLQDSDFDLVLLDLRLGEDDGFEVLSEFRLAYPALPVVVVSARARFSLRIESVDRLFCLARPKRRVVCRGRSLRFRRCWRRLRVWFWRLRRLCLCFVRASGSCSS